MIKYRLNCEFLHSFEAWFSDSASFEKQCDLNLVSCPECGNSKVKRALMTPYLSAGEYKKQSNLSSEAAKLDAVSMEADINDVHGFRGTSNSPKRLNLGSNKQLGPQQVVTMLRNIRSYFEKNGRNVEDKFAEEALKIHYGEKEPDLIYGTCTPEEGEKLEEEGVEFAQLPLLPKDN